MSTEDKMGNSRPPRALAKEYEVGIWKRYDADGNDNVTDEHSFIHLLIDCCVPFTWNVQVWHE